MFERLMKRVGIAQHYVKRDYCTWSPDRLPGIGYIGHHCQRHDDDYARGGTEEDRREADDWLRVRILVQGMSRGYEALARTCSGVYYRMVRLCGRSHFNYHSD
ncbi:MAG: hypothetical protein ABFD89_23735 [Bryobacteraceae bacterium]